MTGAAAGGHHPVFEKDDVRSGSEVIAVVNAYTWENKENGKGISFGVSLVFFNRGEVFESAALAVPPLVYLLGRCLWIARRDRPPRSSPPVWPVRAWRTMFSAE